MAQFPGQTPGAEPLRTFLSELCKVWLVDTFRKVCMTEYSGPAFFFDHSPGNYALLPLSFIFKHQIRRSLFSPQKIEHLYTDFSSFIFLWTLQ